MRKWIDDPYAANHFTGVEAFTEQLAAPGRLGAGQNDGIAKRDTARLMQIESGAKEGGRDLDDFELLVQVELSAYMRGWQLEFFQRDVAVFLKHLRGKDAAGTFIQSLEQRQRGLLLDRLVAGLFLSLRAHILRRYCPPTSNSAFVICPSEQTRTASISTSNTLRFSITAC